MKLLDFKKRIGQKKREAGGSRGFIVRDCRDSYFVVDDEYLNGYGAIVSHQASMIYFCLCRHVGKEQVCYPSYDYLSKKIGFYRAGVIKGVKELEAHGIIRVDRERGQPNIYTLLNKKHWRKFLFVKGRKGGFGINEICLGCLNYGDGGSSECLGCVGGSRASYEKVPRGTGGQK